MDSVPDPRHGSVLKGKGDLVKIQLNTAMGAIITLVTYKKEK